MPKKLALKQGFTLIELMIVIVIVGILGAVAIPKFTKAQHKAKISEFPTILTQIYTAQGAYEAENSHYWKPENAQKPDWNDIGIHIPGSRYFHYHMWTGADQKSYICSAVLKTTIGDGSPGDSATIDQMGEKKGSPSLLEYAPSWSYNEDVP